MTWNLQGRTAEALRLGAALEAWQPDILLLQEADDARLRTALGGLPTQLAWPAAGTRPGVMIAARHAVTAQGLLGPVDEAWDRLPAAWAELRTPAGPILVVSVHLRAPIGPWPPTRRRQRDEQAAMVQAWCADRVAEGASLVVGGDFNTIDPLLPPLHDTAVTSQATWRFFSGGWARARLRLDALFVSDHLTVQRSVVDRRYPRSDHLPVVADLSVSRR